MYPPLWPVKKNNKMTKEEIKEYNKQYALKNKEKIAERRAKDYAEKKDSILKQQREAYAKNPEKKLKKCKEYYLKNKESIYKKEKERKAKKVYIEKLLNEWNSIYGTDDEIKFRSPSDLIDILYDEWFDDLDNYIILTKKDIEKYILKRKDLHSWFRIIN